ncbi:LuxR family transcriptional regulator [Trinickia dabaoshanensis]|uniref:LuxR family transcriptional regulator n=1 Tax=Trinickia dabaoshanensis TaxID=564714 RepID=A0A2N7VDZ3_9BURK|nr:autoinducer binding domain-containing protein [Trinickia dabaoshanensis]PMS15357.1 LuxR family transcriptional regulator [Trinickia dabaoshanensis]
MTSDDEFPALVWFSQGDALAHLSRLDATAHVDGQACVLRECRERLQQAGFSSFSYMALETIGRRILRAYAMREMGNVRFTTVYLKSRLYETDPRLAALRESGLPVTWNLDELEVRSNSAEPRVRSLLSTLRAHAMHSGLILGLPAPRADLRVAVTLSAEASDTSWIDDRVMGTVLAASLTIGRTVQPFVEECARMARVVTLSDEQAAVLERLVKGLSDHEIAAETASSAHRVSQHVKMLQKSFNVENRAQLAYLAARWGWSRS